MKIDAFDLRDKKIKSIKLDFDTICKHGCPVGVVIKPTGHEYGLKSELLTKSLLVLED